MKNIKHRVSTIAILLVAVIGVFAAQASAKAINGYYVGDDGAAYFVTQVDDKIYWVCETNNGEFANVMSGIINGTKIVARWWDIPKGKTMSSGDIILDVKDGGNSLTKISSSSPYKVKTITVAPPDLNVGGLRVSYEAQRLAFLRSKPEGFRGSPENISGIWTGEDFATYYVREMPNGEVVWFAENNFWGDPGGEIRPPFARVFIGKKADNSISGRYVDVAKGVESGNAPITVQIVNQQLIDFYAQAGFSKFKITRSLPNSLRGYADLHTHPMVNLGFGGKLIHGGVDVGSLLPADSDCNHNVRAKSIAQALGNDKSTHGGPGLENPCGDLFREAFHLVFQTANEGALVTTDNAKGYPSFANYPKWNDISHQKMWIDWIRRSYDGGQRVMVALAVNNATLAAAVSGPGDGPNDDANSADLQIKEMKDLVARHPDFMEVAFSAADIRRIVAANKMAVVIGIEVDNIGNLNKFAVQPVPQSVITAEIKRLHDEGVRYIFPVHVLDNAFGHTAVYQDLFNYSNKREEGHFWDLQCADKGEGITYKFSTILGNDVASKAVKGMLSALSGVKVSLDLNAPAPPNCSGHKNKFGLTPEGHFAIKQMMKLGMLVDVDHMSEKGVYETLADAEQVPGGYPLVSGHNNIRPAQGNENTRTSDQLERIGKLGGMFGLGSDGVLANDWAARYVIADDWIRGGSGKGSQMIIDGHVAFGTDLDGLVKGPPPRSGSAIYKNGFFPSQTGDKIWDYRKDGVAHYGMLADFREDIRTVPTNGERVYSSMMKNAEMFAEMWEKAEKESKFVK